MRSSKPTYSMKRSPFANYKEFAEYGNDEIGIFEAKCSGTCGQCGGGGGHCAKCGANFKTKTAKRAKK